MTSVTQRITVEWNNNNRLRIGSYVILLILGWLVIDMLQLEKQELNGQQQQLQIKLEKIKRITNEKDWPEKAASIRKQLLLSEQKLWRADSLGLAQAQIQSWLAAELQRNRITGARLKVDKAKTMKLENQDFWRVTATIEGIFAVEDLLRLLFKIEAYRQLFVIEKLDVRQTTDTRNSLVMTAYFKAKS